MYNTYDYDYEIRMEHRAEAKRMKKSGPMTDKEWTLNYNGSASPQSSSFENIFAAYHDYRNSQQWN